MSSVVIAAALSASQASKATANSCVSAARICSRRVLLAGAVPASAAASRGRASSNMAKVLGMIRAGWHGERHRWAAYRRNPVMARQNAVSTGNKWRRPFVRRSNALDVSGRTKRRLIEAGWIRRQALMVLLTSRCRTSMTL
ncbi:hypothetical protein D3C81_1651600 [compost metagenome]